MAGLTKTATALSLSRKQVLPAATIVWTSERNQSNLAAFKRGTGGRSSFSGIVATVFGASGFLGKYVVNKLGKVGSQIILPYRGDAYYMKDLKLAGDLGQVLFMPIHLRDEESIRKAVKYSNVVINLVGRDYETKNFSFKDVHVDGAQRIARIAKEQGVEKFIHLSHLNASPDPQRIYMKEGSKYLISKYEGEQRVREEFPEAVIFKSADMYGPEDRFLRYYADPWRRNLNTIPLWKRGTETTKMPVFVSDVATGVINAIHDPSADGNTYECVGPNKYYLSDLVDYILRCTRRETVKRFYVTPLFRAKVAYFGKMPFNPVLNSEKLEQEHVSDLHTGRRPTLEDLGVKLLRLEDRAPWELKPYRAHNYYDEKIGEFPDPIPPPVITP